MSAYIAPLRYLQILFLPGLIALLGWALWRTLRHKDLAVGLALYLGLVVIVDSFLNTGLFLPGFEKGSIRYSELCALWLFLNRPSPDQPLQWHRTVLFFVGLYFALLFLSALRADPMMSGIFEFRRLIITQIVALTVAIRGLESKEDYSRFFICLTAIVLIIGIIAFFDVFFDRTLLKSEMLYKPEYWMNRKQGRFGSIFLNPNFLGAFTVLVFPSLFIWTINETKPKIRLYALTGLLFLIFCLVETKSRGPLLAFAISLMLLIIGPVGSLSRFRRIVYLTVFVLIFSIFMPGFYKTSTERFSSLEKEVSAKHAISRQTTWLFTKRIITDNPILGMGFGELQFLKAMDKYGFDERYGVRSLDNPHNSYLQIAIYAGLPALLAFLIANCLMLLKVFGVLIRNENRENSHIIFGLAVGLVGFLACIYPDMHLFTQNIAPVYWVFFGILLNLASKGPRATSDEPT